MATDTVLTKEQIQEALSENNLDGMGIQATLQFAGLARAIEQAVLQSPEVQRLREDAERYQHLRACNSSSLMIIKMASRGDDCPDQVLVEFDADEAIDAAMEKQP